MVGYECYSFQDYFQLNGAPVSFKITYGSFNNSGAPQAWIIFGSGTNGTGNTTGNGIGQTGSGAASGNSSGGGNGMAIFNSSFDSAASHISYCCGDSNTGNGDSRLVCAFTTFDNAMGTTSNTGGALLKGNTSLNFQMISIERTKDANGNPTSNGVLFICPSGGAGAVPSYQQVYFPTANFAPWRSNSSATGIETTLGVMCPDMPMMGDFGSNMPYGCISPEQYPFFPIFLTNYGGVFVTPGLNLVLAWEGTGGNTYNQLSDVSGQTAQPIPITVANGTHYFLQPPSQCFSNAITRTAGNPGQTANCVLFFRYE